MDQVCLFPALSFLILLLEWSKQSLYISCPEWKGDLVVPFASPSWWTLRGPSWEARNCFPPPCFYSPCLRNGEFSTTASFSILTSHSSWHAFWKRTSMPFRVCARVFRSQMLSSKRFERMISASLTLQPSANNSGMRDRETVGDANGDRLSPRGASSVLAADATLTPMPRTATLQRATPFERMRLDKLAARPIPQTINLPAWYLWSVGVDGGLIDRFAEDVENEEAFEL